MTRAQTPYAVNTSTSDTGSVTKSPSQASYAYSS